MSAPLRKGPRRAAPQQQQQQQVDSPVVAAKPDAAAATRVEYSASQDARRRASGACAKTQSLPPPVEDAPAAAPRRLGSSTQSASGVMQSSCESSPTAGRTPLLPLPEVVAASASGGGGGGDSATGERPPGSPFSASPVAGQLLSLQSRLKLSEGLSCVDYLPIFRALAIGSTRQLHVLEVVPAVAYDAARAAEFAASAAQDGVSNGVETGCCSGSTSAVPPAPSSSPFVLRSAGSFGGILKVESVAWYPSDEEASIAFIQPGRSITIFLDALQLKPDGTVITQQWARAQRKEKTLHAATAVGSGSTASAVVAVGTGGSMMSNTPMTTTSMASSCTRNSSIGGTAVEQSPTTTSSSTGKGPSSVHGAAGPRPPPDGPCVIREQRGPLAKELIELNIDVTYMRVDKIVWDPHHPYTLALSSTTTYFELWQIPVDGERVYAPRLILRPPAHNSRAVVRDVCFSPSDPHLIVVMAEAATAGQVLLYDRRQVEVPRAVDCMAMGPGLAAAFHPLFSDLLAVCFRREKTKSDCRIAFFRVLEDAAPLPPLLAAADAVAASGRANLSTTSSPIRTASPQQQQQPYTLVPSVFSSGAPRVSSADNVTDAACVTAPEPVDYPGVVLQDALPPIDYFASVSRLRWRPSSYGALTGPHPSHHYYGYRPSIAALLREGSSGDARPAGHEQEWSRRRRLNLLSAQMWFATTATTTDLDVSVWDAANGRLPVCSVSYQTRESREPNDFVWVNEMTIAAVFKGGEVVVTSLLNNIASVTASAAPDAAVGAAAGRGGGKDGLEGLSAPSAEAATTAGTARCPPSSSVVLRLPQYPSEDGTNVFSLHSILPTAAVASDFFGRSFVVRNSADRLKRHYSRILQEECRRLVERLVAQVTAEEARRPLIQQWRNSLLPAPPSQALLSRAQQQQQQQQQRSASSTSGAGAREEDEVGASARPHRTAARRGASGLLLTRSPTRPGTPNAVLSPTMPLAERSRYSPTQQQQQPLPAVSAAAAEGAPHVTQSRQGLSSSPLEAGGRRAVTDTAAPPAAATAAATNAAPPAASTSSASGPIALIRRLLGRPSRSGAARPHASRGTPPPQPQPQVPLLDAAQPVSSNAPVIGAATEGAFDAARAVDEPVAPPDGGGGGLRRGSALAAAAARVPSPAPPPPRAVTRYGPAPEEGFRSAAAAAAVALGSSGGALLSSPVEHVRMFPLLEQTASEPIPTPQDATRAAFHGGVTRAYSDSSRGSPASPTTTALGGSADRYASLLASGAASPRTTDPNSSTQAAGPPSLPLMYTASASSSVRARPTILSAAGSVRGPSWPGSPLAASASPASAFSGTPVSPTSPSASSSRAISYLGSGSKPAAGANQAAPPPPAVALAQTPSGTASPPCLPAPLQCSTAAPHSTGRQKPTKSGHAAQDAGHGAAGVADTVGAMGRVPLDTLEGSLLPIQRRVRPVIEDFLLGDDVCGWAYTEREVEQHLFGCYALNWDMGYELALNLKRLRHLCDDATERRKQRQRSRPHATLALPPGTRSSARARNARLPPKGTRAHSASPSARGMYDLRGDAQLGGSSGSSDDDDDDDADEVLRAAIHYTPRQADALFASMMEKNARICELEERAVRERLQQQLHDDPSRELVRSASSPSAAPPALRDPRSQWWRAAAHAWRSRKIDFIVSVTTAQLDYASLVGDVQFCLVLYVLFTLWWRLRYLPARLQAKVAHEEEGGLADGGADADEAAGQARRDPEDHGLVDWSKNGAEAPAAQPLSSSSPPPTARRQALLPQPPPCPLLPERQAHAPQPRPSNGAADGSSPASPLSPLRSTRTPVSATAPSDAAPQPSPTADGTSADATAAGGCTPQVWKLRALQWLEAYTAELYARTLYVPINELLLIFPEITQEPGNPVQPRAADVAYEKQMTYVYCGHCTKSELDAHVPKGKDGADGAKSNVDFFHEVVGRGRERRRRRRRAHERAANAAKAKRHSSVVAAAAAAVTQEAATRTERPAALAHSLSAPGSPTGSDDTSTDSSSSSSSAASDGVFASSNGSVAFDTPSLPSLHGSEDVYGTGVVDAPAKAHREHRRTRDGGGGGGQEGGRSSSSSGSGSGGNRHRRHNSSPSLSTSSSSSLSTRGTATGSRVSSTSASRCSSCGRRAAATAGRGQGHPSSSNDGGAREQPARGDPNAVEANDALVVAGSTAPRSVESGDGVMADPSAGQTTVAVLTAVDYDAAHQLIPLADNATCRRCRNRLAMRCVVCEEVVEGMYYWLRSCGHGGHVHHLEEWLKISSECPRCGTAIASAMKQQPS